jgi:alpha-methylacyl-CoA racemase
MPLPLAGIRVLDLSWLLPGPFASLLLAELGADVVKIEDPAGGDPARLIPPLVDGQGAVFAALNRGKRSLALNLKSPTGCEAFQRLATRTDVILESFRPGTTERLGISYQAICTVNPGVVYCSVSGYGQTGPLHERAGHDVNYLALSGILGLTGTADGLPTIPAVQIADLAGSMFAVLAILAALRVRDRYGEGRYLDLAMFDASLAWLLVPVVKLATTGEVPLRGRQFLTGAFPCYNVYRTADGGFMALGALEPHFWEYFCDAAGRPDLLPRQFDPSAIAEVQTVFAGYSRQEWTERLAGIDCCCEPVLALDEALSQPQAQHRAVWALGGGSIPELHSPLRAVGVAGPLPPAPALGQHSTEILDEAGLSPVEIEAVLAANHVEEL